MKKIISEIIAKIRKGSDLESHEKREYINYSIANHEGKMHGIRSISTSNLLNPLCKARKNSPDSRCICKRCYADTLCNMREGLRIKLVTNTLFYTKYELTEKDIPHFNDDVFRLESFGDIMNALQVKNYCTIARANKQTFFVLWTKNPCIIAKALEDYNMKIPNNLRVIYSEPYMDSKWDIREYRKGLKSKYPFVSKVFQVFTKEAIAARKVSINCGARNCRKCMKCYDKSDRHVFINEQVK